MNGASWLEWPAASAKARADLGKAKAGQGARPAAESRLEMRGEAVAMKSMHDGMMTDGLPTTMPTRMAAQHKMKSTRIGMMERPAASTKALYDSLSEVQRKEFDQMMTGTMGLM